MYLFFKVCTWVFVVMSHLTGPLLIFFIIEYCQQMEGWRKCYHKHLCSYQLGWTDINNLPFGLMFHFSIDLFLFREYNMTGKAEDSFIPLPPLSRITPVLNLTHSPSPMFLFFIKCKYNLHYLSHTHTWTWFAFKV